MRKIRVGLVGFGSSAKTFHLPLLVALPELYEVVGVVDRKGEDALKLVHRATNYPTWDLMARSEKLDLAVICLPNALHAEVTCAFLGAGKHVVVEKPMANNPQEVQTMMRAAKVAERSLTVFHSRRLDGDFLTVKKLVKRQSLGRLVRAEIRYDRWSNALRKKAWKETGRPGDTLLEDLGSHLLDQALHLFGTPVSVSCRLGVQRDGSQTVDAFRISLEYEGLWVDLESSMVVRASPFHWALHGTEGSFIKTGMDPQEARLLAGRLPTDQGFADDEPENFGILTPAQGEPRRISTEAGRYLDFYKNLYDGIMGTSSLSFLAEEGQEVVFLLELCRQSAENQGCKITVS